MVGPKKNTVQSHHIFYGLASSLNCHPPASTNHNTKTARYRSSLSTNCQLMVRRAPTRHRARSPREHQRHQFSKALLRPASRVRWKSDSTLPWDPHAQVWPAISQVLRGDPTRLLATFVLAVLVAFATGVGGRKSSILDK
jgi:hypothetical protein